MCMSVEGSETTSSGERYLVRQCARTTWFRHETYPIWGFGRNQLHETEAEINESSSHRVSFGCDVAHA